MASINTNSFGCLDAIETLCFNTGDTWIPEEKLSYYLYKYGKKNLNDLIPYINMGTIKKAILNNSRFYTTKLLCDSEMESARNILRIANAKVPKYSDRYLNQMIDTCEKERNAKLHVNQREAAIKAINSSFMVLTGGPGTGKTFVLNFITAVHKMLNPNINIIFTAPTGKAARRITESTSFAASTIHKKLEISPEMMNPKPLSPTINLLVCDEVSMLDIYTLNALMKAVQTGTRIILVGDTDQLPSVGPGAILRDLIASEVVPVAQLTATFRQSGDSILFDNIMRVKRGESHLVSGDDFKIAIPQAGMSPQNILLWMFEKEVEKYGIENVLCLTPFRQKGNTCSNVMNREIQKRMNPSGRYMAKNDGTVFRKGDLVMQLENKTLCSNGDVGKVVGVYNSCISVLFDNAEVAYNSENIDTLSLAYSMSIHKSQGSEAASVITCLLKEHEATAQRNLIYTAITRAKKKCSLLCEPSSVEKAIQNEASIKRVTMLQEFLRYGAEQLVG